MSPQFHSALSIYKSPQEILKIINFWTLDVSGTASYGITLLCPSVRPSITKFSQDWFIFFFSDIVHDDS